MAKHTHVMTEPGCTVIVGNKVFEYGAKLTEAEAKKVGLSRCKTLAELAEREAYLAKKAEAREAALKKEE